MNPPTHTHALAAEVISNVRGYDGKLADVWSAGVMLYTMLFARYPFERPEDKKLRQNERLQRILHRIMKVDYVFPDYANISEECKDMIQHILVADPAKRYTIKQIQQHPWFQHELPPGSLEYNDWALNLDVTPAQTSEGVDAIIQSAKEALDAKHRQGRPPTDIFSSGFMDAE